MAIKALSERHQWFLDRIGKTVYRNKNSCNCSVCARVFEQGLVISDEDQADYIAMCEGEYTAEGIKLKYFDTKKEAQEYEKSNSP